MEVVFFVLLNGFSSRKRKSVRVGLFALAAAGLVVPTAAVIQNVSAATVVTSTSTCASGSGAGKSNAQVVTDAHNALENAKPNGALLANQIAALYGGWTQNDPNDFDEGNIVAVIEGDNSLTTNLNTGTAAQQSALRVSVENLLGNPATPIPPAPAPVTNKTNTEVIADAHNALENAQPNGALLANRIAAIYGGWTQNDPADFDEGNIVAVIEGDNSLTTNLNTGTAAQQATIRNSVEFVLNNPDPAPTFTCSADNAIVGTTPATTPPTTPATVPNTTTTTVAAVPATPATPVVTSAATCAVGSGAGKSNAQVITDARNALENAQPNGALLANQLDALYGGWTQNDPNDFDEGNIVAVIEGDNSLTTNLNAGTAAQQSALRVSVENLLGNPATPIPPAPAPVTNKTNAQVIADAHNALETAQPNGALLANRIDAIYGGWTQYDPNDFDEGNIVAVIEGDNGLTTQLSTGTAAQQATVRNSVEFVLNNPDPAVTFTCSTNLAVVATAPAGAPGAVTPPAPTVAVAPAATGTTAGPVAAPVATPVAAPVATPPAVTATTVTPVTTPTPAVAPVKAKKHHRHFWSGWL